jgi:hypothetical protein
LRSAAAAGNEVAYFVDTFSYQQVGSELKHERLSDLSNIVRV